MERLDLSRLLMPQSDKNTYLKTKNMPERLVTPNKYLKYISAIYALNLSCFSSLK